jgi:hypothetical protein
MSQQAMKKEKNIQYVIEVAGLPKKKVKKEKKIPVEFESIKIMNKSEIYWYNITVLRRIFISYMEFVLASVNSAGS